MEVENLKLISEIDLGEFFADLKKIYSELDRLEARMESVKDLRVSAHIDLNEHQQEQLQSRLEQIESTSDLSITPDIDVRAADLQEAFEQARRSSQLDFNATPNINSGQLAVAWEKAVRKVSPAFRPNVYFNSGNISAAFKGASETADDEFAASVGFSPHQIQSAFKEASAPLRASLDGKVDFDAADLHRQIEVLERLTVRLDTQLQYGASLARLYGAITQLEARGVNIPVRFRERLAPLYATIAALEASHVNIPVRFNAEKSLRGDVASEVAKFRKSLKENPLEMGVQLSNDAEKRLKDLNTQTITFENTRTLSRRRGKRGRGLSNIDTSSGTKSMSDGGIKALTDKQLRTANRNFKRSRKITEKNTEKLQSLNNNVRRLQRAFSSADRRTMATRSFDKGNLYRQFVDNFTTEFNRRTRDVSDGRGPTPNRAGYKTSRSGSKRRIADHSMLTSRSSDSGLMDIFNLRAADIHNIRAKLFPALVSMAMALPAVVTSLIALGTAAIGATTALLGIAGLGLAGMAAQRSGTGKPTGEALMEILKEIGNDAWEAFEPLANRLAPTMERGVDSMDLFFTKLAAASDVLLDMRPEARQFGKWAMQAIPNLLENLFRLGDAFSGIFAMIAGGLDGDAFFENLARWTALALPYLIQLGRAIKQILPALTNLSIGFLRVSSIIFSVIAAVAGLLNRFPMLTRLLGTAAATGMFLFTVFALLNTQMFTMAGAAIMSLGKAVASMIMSFTTLSSVLQGTALSSYFASGAIRTLTLAVLGLMAVTGIGLVVSAIGLIGSKAIQSKTEVDSLTDSLNNLDSVGNDMSGPSGVYDAPEPETQKGQSAAKIGPSMGSNGDTHFHTKGASNEDLDRVADKNNWKRGRFA